jgi:hypothetical protein
MSNDFLDNAYLLLSGDTRINVWHMSIYLALLYKLRGNGFQSPVQITRKEVMLLAHVGSIATYHKCIRQLQDYGYIDYVPSFDHYKKTAVHFVNAATGKAKISRPRA